MILFDKLDIVIENRGILAQSVSLSSTVATDSHSPLGFRGSLMSATNQVVTNLNFSYYLRDNTDDNLALISRLKNGDQSKNELSITVGELEGAYHLQRFSLSVQPNQPIIANVSYASYSPITGTVTGAERVIYDYNDGSLLNVGHGWATYVNSAANGSHLTVPAYDLQYECAINWRPVYVITATNPQQVVFLNGQESVEFTRDDFIHPTVPLKRVDQTALWNSAATNMVSLKNITYNWDARQDLPILDLNLRKAYLVSEVLSASQSNQVKCAVTLESNF